MLLNFVDTKVDKEDLKNNGMHYFYVSFGCFSFSS